MSVRLMPMGDLLFSEGRHKMGGSVGRGKTGVEIGKRKEMGNCCWNVIYERIKKKKNNSKPLLAR